MNIWASAVLWDVLLKKTGNMADLLPVLKKYDLSGFEVRPYWKSDPLVEAKELAEAGKKTNIFFSYACYESLLSTSLEETKRQLEFLKDSVEIASILNSQVLRVNIDEQADWGLLDLPEWKDHVQKVLRFAVDRNIRLVLENPPHRINGSLKNIEKMLEILPNLQLTFDTGNWIVAGEHPATALSLFSEKIGYLHLKDIRLIGSGGYEHCQPGLGGFEFSSFLVRIQKMGYRGPAVLEFGAGVQSEKHLRGALKYLEVYDNEE